MYLPRDDVLPLVQPASKGASRAPEGDTLRWVTAGEHWCSSSRRAKMRNSRNMMQVMVLGHAGKATPLEDEDGQPESHSGQRWVAKETTAK